MAINKTQNTHFYACNLNTPAKKYAAEAGAITLLIVGLLGMGCAILGPPSFAHTWHCHRTEE